MSRPTLYRIEHGEPSVTMGAYLAAIAAVGLELHLTDPLSVKPHADAGAGLPPCGLR